MSSLRGFVNNLRIYLQAVVNYAKAIAAICGRKDAVQQIMVPNVGISNVILVDPNKIEYYCSVPIKPRRGNRFFVAGDWAAGKISMDEVEQSNPKYLSCRQFLLDDAACEETEEYRQIADIISREGAYRGCRSREEIVAYLQDVAATCRSIRDNGYRSQLQQGRSRYVGEIECALDGAGNLIKINAGNHRFAAARILKLKAVPVSLCFVHGDHAARFDSSPRSRVLAELNAFITAVEQRYS